MNNLFTVFSFLLKILDTPLTFSPFSFTIGDFFISVSVGSLICALVNHFFSD